MKASTLFATTSIYECATENATRRARISHEQFRQFSFALKNLRSGLGGASADEAWKSILAPLRRYGFAICSAPLPFNEPTICPRNIEDLRARRVGLSMVYPAETVFLGLAIDCLAALVQSYDNPFGSWLAESALGTRGKRAVVIRDSRLISAVEIELARDPASRKLHVITPAQLTRDTTYDQLYVVGAANWFPTYIFDAPRAKRIDIVSYSWIKDQPERSRMFLTTAAPVATPPSDSSPIDDSYDASDVLPVIDWRGIGERMAAGDLHTSTESAEARLVLLEGDRAVFLELSDGASILTIDLDADETTERIARIPTNGVRAGVFLLLRTSGGGDYIVEEADRYFLKERAAEIREAQREWKELLRREVRKDGLLGVTLRLLDLGSSSAEEINVRNYMSLRSIRTRTAEDFQAIMRLVGLGEQWQRYWDMMGEIDNAHRRAGHRVRHQLLRRLEQLDLMELERAGHLDITLPDIDAGSLTAYRVVDVSPDSQPVVISRLGHPFEL